MLHETETGRNLAIEALNSNGGAGGVLDGILTGARVNRGHQGHQGRALYGDFSPEELEILQTESLEDEGAENILKVSRTIADVAGADEIRPVDLAEAVGYRSLDRTYWT